MNSVILGGAGWNTMIDVGRFPEPHAHTVFAHGMHQAIGASGAGKALNLAGLGVDVDLWALVGDDEPGTKVRDGLEAAGVQFHAVTDPHGTSQHFNLMNAEGERISIFGNAGSLSAAIDPEPMRLLIERADMIAVTILDHCRAFLPIAAAADGDLWIDIHDYDGVNPHHDEFIACADALLMSSIAMPDWRPFLEAQVAGGVKVAIATHGSAGASGLTAGVGWVEVAPVVADVVDTNGAGDAFFAGFCVANAAGETFEASLHAGAAHAARAVASPNLAPHVSEQDDGIAKR
ncbi:MAG: carbohydrate kinase family protein [Acidimicrobiia bacterium]